MRKMLLPTLPWILFLVAPTQPANAADDGNAPVVQLEHAWLTAARHHDRAALDRILASDFIDTDVHGQTRDKAATLAHHGAPAGTSQTLHDLKIRRHGDMAIATGINRVHSDAQGWTVRVAFTDVFVREHGHWHAVSAQETLVHPATTPSTHH